MHTCIYILGMDNRALETCMFAVFQMMTPGSTVGVRYMYSIATKCTEAVQYEYGVCMLQAQCTLFVECLQDSVFEYSTLPVRSCLGKCILSSGQGPHGNPKIYLPGLEHKTTLLPLPALPALKQVQANGAARRQQT